MKKESSVRETNNLKHNLALCADENELYRNVILHAVQIVYNEPGYKKLNPITKV